MIKIKMNKEFMSKLAIAWLIDEEDLGGITPDENATYKIIDGTCWE